MKKLLLSVFCCLLVFSCSKEEEIVNIDSQSRLASEFDISKAGEIHNLLLSEYGTHGAWSYNKMQVYSTDNYSFLSAYVDNLEEVSMSREELEDMVDEISNGSILSNLVNDGLISNEFILIFDAYFFAISEMDSLSEITAYSDSFRSGIGNLNLSIEEKEVMLGTSYVLDASAIFWYEAASNSSSVYHDDATNYGNMPQIARKIKWRKLLGDAIGFAAGAICCGPGIGVGIGAMVSGAM